MDKDVLENKLLELKPLLDNFRFDEQYDNDELYIALENLQTDIDAILIILAHPKPNPFRVI
ncbi:MAG: hypothetical protein CTY34_09470 [Methylobacter sp.]|nr:MAG: hypothetical protein CTY34_09470 [Methylobacter sp.]PPD03177.1 MAG: hypothetical protein CTY29_10445 [Methylobacter sp.]PPD18719.1 MAG: hypothetical protein CTY24_12470 [Methylobacter sp.]PPD35983.1 MAG: hypothetical protein CTY18_05765 [Methylomonas sp.]